MKLKVLLFIAFAGGALLNTQAQNIAGLQQELMSAKSGPRKIALLKALADSTFETSKEQCSRYVNALQEEASRLGDVLHLAVAAHRLGNLSYAAGQPDSARMQYLSAYELYWKAGNKVEALNAYCRAGIMYSLKGHYPEAEKIYRKAISRANGQKKVLAFAFNQLGTLYHYQGITDSAHHYYGESTVLYGVLKDTSGMLRPMYNHAVLLMESGKIKEGIQLQLEIYGIQKQRNSIGDLQYTTQALANAYSTTYENIKALQYAKESYEYARQMQESFRMTLSLVSLAKVNMSNQDTAQAIRYLDQALILADSAQLRDQQQSIRVYLGETYRQQGKYDAAVTVLTQGLAIADSVVESRIRPDLLNSLGEIWLAVGDLKKAEESLYEAIRLTENTGLNSSLWDAYTALADLYLKGNNPRKAILWGLKVNQSGPADDTHLKRAIINTSILHQAYKQLGMYQEALQYHEIYKTLSDSLNNVRQIREITIQSKDFAFELEKRQLELERSQSEALLQAQARQDKITAVGVGALAILGFGFLLHARRKNRIISLKNLQLEQLNLTKDRIFAIIGHDLRKPALAFRGITEKISYLLRKQDFDTLNALGGQLEQDAQALHQLTDNLLSWALTQKDVLPYAPASLSLRRESVEVCDLFRSVSASKNITLDIQVPPHQEVYADKNTLHTILRNLLDNAIKFSLPGSTVVLSATSSEEGVVIKIADLGTGIPQEKLRDIYLLQKGKSQPGTTGERGTGLGLHLVKELVQLNRGNIEIWSQPDEGTEVRLLLPVA